MTKRQFGLLFTRANEDWLSTLERLWPSLSAHAQITTATRQHMLLSQIGVETSGLSLTNMRESMRYSANRAVEKFSYRLGLALGRDKWRKFDSRTDVQRRPRSKHSKPPRKSDIRKLAVHLCKGTGEKNELFRVVYGGREGTPQDQGDRYIGRGPTQITHLNNYRRVMQLIRKQPGGEKCPDLVKQPEALEQPEWGVRALFADWMDKGLNRTADTGSLLRVRKHLNLGNPNKRAKPNGMSEASRWLKRAKKTFPDGVPTMTKRKTSKASRPLKSNKPRGKRNPKSQILPLYRPRQSEAVTRAILNLKSDLTPDDHRDDPVKVLVVRGYFQDSMGVPGKNDRAMYDDAIFVASPDGVAAFNGNSDPAVFRRRIATIKSNQAVCYKPGLHGLSSKKPYPAFRQHEDCTVVRDKTGDDHGMFYVNMHRGGVTGTSSAGCITVPPHQWSEYYGLLSRQLQKYGQETFYATVLEYDGDNPPIQEPIVPSIEEENATNGAIGVALVAAALAIAGWFDSLSTYIGGLF